MRRTPDFEPFVNGSSNNTILYRPDSLVGDYLENRRILKALHERFHFPELEGIIDGEGTLDAFYLFDGTRFIKDRVIGLFDDSEYSFSNMLSHLSVAALQNFNFPADVPSYRRTLELRRDFLLNYEGSFEFDYFSDLVAFVDMEGPLPREEDLSLYSYHSDTNSSIWPVSLEGLWSVFDVWTSYMKSDYLFLTRKKRFWQYFRESKLLMGKVLHIDEKMKPFNNASMRFHISSYMMKLSACLNLPDDKYAEPGEKILIDNWFELFDKFYPKYEKLKVWYVNEKEKTDRVGVTA